MLARAAHCDVTPRDRPVRLAGYASRQTPVSTILDSIEIAALLLEGGGRRCLILSFDLMIVGKELADLIQSRLHALGFRPDEVMMLASHTHCAPATDSACARLGTPDPQFIRDATEAVETLVRRIQREPAARNMPRGVSRESRPRHQSPPLLAVSDLRQDAGAAMGQRDLFALPGRSARRAGERHPDQGGGRPHAARGFLALRLPSDLRDRRRRPSVPTIPALIRRLLRQRFGDIPCLFAPGFCGDITPRLVPAEQRQTLGERVAKFRRMIIAGYTVPTITSADAAAWRESLVARLAAIIADGPAQTLRPEGLRSGSSSIPLSAFFSRHRARQEADRPSYTAR